MDVAEVTLPPKPFFTPAKRILDLVHNRAAEFKCTFLFAPLGFGKTAVLAQWAHDIKDGADAIVHIAWVALCKHSHNQDICALLFEALKRTLQGFDVFENTLTFETLSNALYWYARKSPSHFIFEENDKNPYLYIVIDGFEMAFDAEEGYALVRFAQSLPDGIHVIFAGNMIPDENECLVPPFPQAAVVLEEDLRWNDEDVHALAEQASVVLEEGEAASVCDEYKGWPYGILLYISREKGSIKENALELCLNDYWAAWGNRANDSMKDLVLQLGCLDFYSAALVDGLVCENAGDNLRALERSGIIQIEKKSKEGRLHLRFPGFAEWAKREVFQRDKAMVRRLNHKAYLWAQKRGLFDYASRCLALSYDANELAIDYESYLPPWLRIRSGLYEKVFLAPTHKLLSSPNLTLLVAAAYLCEGELEGAQRCVDRLHKTLSQKIVDDEKCKGFEVALNVMQMRIHALEGEFEKCVELIHMLEAPFGEAGGAANLHCNHSLAELSERMGDFKESQTKYIEAEYDARINHDVIREELIRYERAWLGYLWGDSRKAYSVSLKTLHESSPHSVLYVNHLLLQALLCLETGAVVQAVEYAARASESESPRHRNVDWLLDVNAVRALMNASQGERDAALAIIARALRDVRGKIVPRNSLFYASSIAVMLHLSNGDIAASRMMIDGMKSQCCRDDRVGSLYIEAFEALCSFWAQESLCFREDLFERTKATGTPHLQIVVEVTVAAAAIKREDRDVCVSALRQALCTSADARIMSPFFCFFPILQTILKGLVDSSSENSTVRKQAKGVISAYIVLNPQDDYSMRNRTEELLTMRECEILRLLELGLSRSEMAAELSVSLNTIKSHMKSLYRKLGATNKNEAISISRAKGFLV